MFRDELEAGDVVIAYRTKNIVALVGDVVVNTNLTIRIMSEDLNRKEAKLTIQIKKGCIGGINLETFTGIFYQATFLKRSHQEAQSRYWITMSMSTN